jgi:hypothetical protein
MALFHSPNVVTNGLVFYYDIGNPQKSWKGAPTVNRVVTIPYASDVYTACSGPISATATDATGQPRTVNRYTITSTGGVPRARIIATGLTTGVNYTYSLKIKYNGPVAAPSYYIDSSKGNPETNNNSFTSRTQTITPIGNGWYQIVESFVFSACPTGGAWSNFGLSAPDASYLNQTFDAYDIQFEQQSFATPYVNGTRSNTQAILDLTNNNTVTATSLTYASDGTFSFNGSTNHLTCGDNPAIAAISGTTAVTVEAWVNLTGYGSSGYGVITHKGNPWAWLMENPSNRMRIRFGLSVSGDVSCADSSTHALNTWYQFVGTYDGFNMRFYRNGVLTNTVAASGTLGGSGINMVVGNFSGAYYSQGQIPIVKIYNRTLTNAEVQQNFQALRGRYGL